MNNNKPIVFSIEQSAANQSFLYKTFNILNKIYFGNILECLLESDINIEDFESPYFEELKNSILIKGGKANYTQIEFDLLVKSINFVLKYFKLNPNNKLSKILKSESYPKHLFPNNEEFGSNFDFESIRLWYENKANELLNSFANNTTN